MQQVPPVMWVTSMERAECSGSYKLEPYHGIESALTEEERLKVPPVWRSEGYWLVRSNDWHWHVVKREQSAGTWIEPPQDVRGGLHPWNELCVVALRTNTTWHDREDALPHYAPQWQTVSTSGQFKDAPQTKVLLSISGFDWCDPPWGGGRLAEDLDIPVWKAEVQRQRERMARQGKKVADAYPVCAPNLSPFGRKRHTLSPKEWREAISPRLNGRRRSLAASSPSNAGSRKPSPKEPSSPMARAMLKMQVAQLKKGESKLSNRAEREMDLNIRAMMTFKKLDKMMGRLEGKFAVAEAISEGQDIGAQRNPLLPDGMNGAPTSHHRRSASSAKRTDSMVSHLVYGQSVLGSTCDTLSQPAAEGDRCEDDTDEDEIEQLTLASTSVLTSANCSRRGSRSASEYRSGSAYPQRSGSEHPQRSASEHPQRPAGTTASEAARSMRSCSLATTSARTWATSTGRALTMRDETGSRFSDYVDPVCRSPPVEPMLNMPSEVTWATSPHPVLQHSSDTFIRPPPPPPSRSISRQHSRHYQSPHVQGHSPMQNSPPPTYNAHGAVLSPQSVDLRPRGANGTGSRWTSSGFRAHSVSPSGRWSSTPVQAGAEPRGESPGRMELARSTHRGAAPRQQGSPFGARDSPPLLYAAPAALHAARGSPTRQAYGAMAEDSHQPSAYTCSTVDSLRSPPAGPPGDPHNATSPLGYDYVTSAR